MPATPRLRHLPRSRSAALAILVAAGACGGVTPRAEPDLREGDRVRFVAPGFSRQARMGMVGRAGKCISVMVPDQLPAPRRFDVVPVDSLTELQVNRTPGEQAPDPPRVHAALGAAREERWVPVSVAAVKKRYGACRPGE